MFSHQRHFFRHATDDAYHRLQLDAALEQPLTPPTPLTPESTPRSTPRSTPVHAPLLKQEKTGCWSSCCIFFNNTKTVPSINESLLLTPVKQQMSSSHS